MSTAARILGYAALALTLAAPLLNAWGAMGDAVMKHCLGAACVLWFVTAPLFLKGGSE